VAHDSSYHTDTARLEAFSDGVFAIAITLLIIEIGVPHVEGEGLARALRELWPSYIGFALSFITIGIMWSNHHGMFKDIERVDHTMIVLNLMLLLCISFIPFPTAVLAEYMTDDANALAATLAYGGSFTVTALFFNATWLYASRGRRLIDDHVSDMRVRDRTRRYLPGTPLYALGLPLALVSTWLSLGLWIALAVLYLLPLQD
jgi:uncharacterized membrane protein